VGFFKNLFGFLSQDLAIDLGTANTLVLVKGKGIVINEPSVVAVKVNKLGQEEILAVGQEAKDMVGKTPGSIKAIRPMRDGVIADFNTTEMMIEYFIKKVNGANRFASPRIEEPMAAAIGAGLPVKEPNGNLVVDIGGGTTEIGVTSLGGLVISKSIRVAGDKHRVAENLKIQIGTAIKLNEQLTTMVRGRDQVEGSLSSVEITSEHIREAISTPLHQIAEALKSVLEQTPPELAGDIVENGIVLTGGGSLIRGLDRYLSEIVKLPVYIAEEPLLAVAKAFYFSLYR